MGSRPVVQQQNRGIHTLSLCLFLWLSLFIVLFGIVLIFGPSVLWFHIEMGLTDKLSESSCYQKRHYQFLL